MHDLIVGLRAGFALWLFLLMVADTIGVPLPSEVPLLFGGYLASTGELNIVLAVTMATLGATSGSLVLYALSRRYGRAAVLRWGRRFGITEEQLRRSDEWFARRGEAAVLLCRMVPLARTLISIPAGIAGMKAGRFTLYTFAGSLPWSLALILLGYSLGENWERVLGSFSIASAVVAGLILVGLAWWLVRRRRARAAR